MQIINEFKKFAMRGNVIDLAVGVIIGGAFGKIVSSLVNDIVMPPIGLLLGGVNFMELKLVLKESTDGAKAITLNYGNFLQSTIDFLIVAAAIFLMIKAINTFQKKEAEKPSSPPVSNQEKLLTEIRDVLKKQSK